MHIETGSLPFLPGVKFNPFGRGLLLNISSILCPEPLFMASKQGAGMASLPTDDHLQKLEANTKRFQQNAHQLSTQIFHTTRELNEIKAREPYPDQKKDIMALKTLLQQLQSAQQNAHTNYDTLQRTTDKERLTQFLQQYK